MLSEQKLNRAHYPYQVINGKVYDLSIPCRQLEPEEILVIKPLVPLLVYLTSGGASIKESVEWCKCAAKIGDLEALQWLRDAGAPWDVNTCANAALNGHLEVLCWARSNGAPWDEWTCIYAAYSGNRKMLCWAVLNGAPWDNNVCFIAAENKHFELFKWAYINGCPCSKIDTPKVQKLLLKEKDINWSLQCKERWSEDNRELFHYMIDQVVNECNKVTYDLLPTCLSNLIITYL